MYKKTKLSERAFDASFKAAKKIPKDGVSEIDLHKLIEDEFSKDIISQLLVKVNSRLGSLGLNRRTIKKIRSEVVILILEGFEEEGKELIEFKNNYCKS